MSKSTSFWHETESRPYGGVVKPLIVVRGMNAAEVVKAAKGLGIGMRKAYPGCVEKTSTYARKDTRFPEYGDHYYAVVVLRRKLDSKVAKRVGRYLSQFGIVHLCQLGFVQEECSALTVYVPVDVHGQRKALREVLNRNNATVRQLVDYLARRGFKVPRKTRRADLLQMVATLES